MTWRTCPDCAGPAFIEPEAGIFDYYCPRCGWEEGGESDYGRVGMDEVPFAPPEVFDGLPPTELIVAMPDPMSRCLRCGARHAEHDLVEASLACPGQTGAFG